MQYQSRRKFILLAVVGAFLLLLIVVIVLIGRSSKPKTTGGVYNDPLSHQTVTDVPGKSPENAGSSVDYPVFLGFDKLIDYGLTNLQLQELNQAFYKYSRSLASPIGEVSIDVDNITAQHNPKVHNSPFTLQFMVRLDRKNDYNAKIEYHDIDELRLYLSSRSTNKVIYDSKVVRLQGL